MEINAFAPAGSTVNLAVTSTTGNVALTRPGPERNVRVANVGPNTAFMAFGGAAVTATTTAGIPILAGSVEVFAIGDIDTYAAGITASGQTATLYFTSGLGV